MIAAMFIQQKLYQPSDGTTIGQEQKMMSTIMPILFGAMFYNLPSSMVLYWLVNNILSIVTQYFIMKEKT